MTDRAQTLPCPHCGDELAAVAPDRAKWRCRSCGGILVGAVELEREIGDRGITLETVTGVRTTRHCPQCQEPMTAYMLFGVEIDRCGNDGAVWFDRGELGRARREVPGAIPFVDSLLA